MSELTFPYTMHCPNMECRAKLKITKPTPYGLGKSGWVSVQVGPGSKLPRELLEAWISESWMAIAPKTLARAQAAGATAPTPKAGAPKARTRSAARRRTARS